MIFSAHNIAILFKKADPSSDKKNPIKFDEVYTSKLKSFIVISFITSSKTFFNNDTNILAYLSGTYKHKMHVNLCTNW